MTHAELMALPVIPDPKCAVWREDDDPVLFEDDDGLAWSVMRDRIGKRYRFRMPMYDR